MVRDRNDRTPHTYINADGEEIPSVTHIIAILKKKQTLVWANHMGFRHLSVEKFINHKAMIGTLMHEKIACLFNGQEYKPHMSEGINDEVDALYKNFLTWYEEAKPRALANEKQMVGKYYGGTIDLLCEMYDHKLVLLDFKTSKSLHAAQFLQLGGYMNLFKELEPDTYKKIDLCQIVSITPSKVRIMVKDRKEMKPYQELFTNNYILYHQYDEILTKDWDDGLKDVSIL